MGVKNKKVIKGCLKGADKVDEVGYLKNSPSPKFLHPLESSSNESIVIFDDVLKDHSDEKVDVGDVLVQLLQLFDALQYKPRC